MNKIQRKEYNKQYYLMRKQLLIENPHLKKVSTRTKRKSEYEKAYYNLNKQRILKQISIYRQKHREKIKIYNKNYYESKKNIYKKISNEKIIPNCKKFEINISNSPVVVKF